MSVRNSCIFTNYQVAVGCVGVPCVNDKKIITCRRAGVQGQSFVSVVIAPAVAAVIPGAAFGANGVTVSASVEGAVKVT